MITIIRKQRPVHLHAIAKSPEHYYARYLDPDRKPTIPTAAMKLGTLVHTAVLPGESLPPAPPVYKKPAPQLPPIK